MNNEVLVTFHFTSGQKKEIVYTREKLVEMYVLLRQKWNECCVADDRFGINFAQVTHYEVNEKK